MDDRHIPAILTVAEVATYLRISETTAWRWCQTGRLPAFRFGRSWRVNRLELEQAIKALAGGKDVSGGEQSIEDQS